ncbi:anthranilate synthase component I family protein [Roseivirga sp. UBA1976]|uniref:anthranilate synthase component I family protein n=1 Tax=Roseivirga sp. UBA1976 TaxID=1947386 RepID=UPI00257BD89F|nr:anthranilate synthase component I family protein [Roseivirga sp. UBA1976]MEC7755886.1 anthranilate synthase component I family protein [Bacteroidota bacterium]|tara:strand:+ start:477 stop:1883 length:1407 start_codon:yes stop_codon:yes gene_type:complete
MNKIKLNTTYKKLLADTVTPVSIYLKLRDKYQNAILLESSDYHGDDNSFSYICCEPIARLMVKDSKFEMSLPGHSEHGKVEGNQVAAKLSEFAASFEPDSSEFKFINNGLFGYIGYDAVQYFEQIPVTEGKTDEYEIPDLLYHVYRYVIAIDHFKNELYLFEHSPEGTEPKGIQSIETLVKNKNYPSYEFAPQSEEVSNYTDEEFLSIIDEGMKHCFRGDVFQIVLSRRFQSRFKGDEFNVYRALRSVNPSPYLFYFDFGSFKIFGSSPEAQLVIKDRKATIHPIAGTFKRTGNDEADAELAKKLHADPKENSEHVMLVDLARNDLSRAGSNVQVDTYKEIQYYSHVIHLVSKVTGTLSDDMQSTQMVAGTFPAGTLSGAPKVRAMQLINTNEKTRRGYYGGAIGFMGFNGDFNHAIMIRSFLTKNNTLFYQAGAGVVAKSNRESELQEVNNKLAALRKAIELAKEIR